MKHRIISVLLALALLLGLLPRIAPAARAASSGTCGDNLTWDVLGAQRADIFGVWNDYRRQGLPNDAPAVPDLIIHSVAELPAHLARLARAEGMLP